MIVSRPATRHPLETFAGGSRSSPLLPCDKNINSPGTRDTRHAFFHFETESATARACVCLRQMARRPKRPGASWSLLARTRLVFYRWSGAHETGDDLGHMPQTRSVFNTTLGEATRVRQPEASWLDPPPYLDFHKREDKSPKMLFKSLAGIASQANELRSSLSPHACGDLAPACFSVEL